MSDTKSKKIIEYNEANVKLFSADFVQEMDNYLILQTGTDTSILWKLGAKIVLQMNVISENSANIELATLEIPSGYNAELGLYVLDGKVYVEDDYCWSEIPDQMINLILGQDIGGEFMVNYYEEYYRQSQVTFEPLIVNSFNLNDPVLKVEEAYRNAVCETESYQTCGWIILFHDGHFYLPVESIDDPVNHDTFYFVKVFNSYPVSLTSSRISVVARAELFNRTHYIGIRFRSGYCINWRKLFVSQILPADYLNNIPDLYTITDKPYGLELDEGRGTDYDGFRLREQDDDLDDFDDDFDESDDEPDDD